LYYNIIVSVVGGPDRIEAWSLEPIFLQCSDTVAARKFCSRLASRWNSCYGW